MLPPGYRIRDLHLSPGSVEILFICAHPRLTAKLRDTSQLRWRRQNAIPPIGHGLGIRIDLD
jgi:hypothetical protein